jgi:hypothetical protein
VLLPLNLSAQHPQPQRTSFLIVRSPHLLVPQPFTIAPQPCSLHLVSHFPCTFHPLQRTLLRQEQVVALLDGNPVPRVLVVGRETRRVRALADLAVDDFFERVDALGRVLRVGDKHEMHAA